MSGMGTQIGYTFEQLKYILDNSEYSANIGVCFDMCHVHGAGYDIVSCSSFNRTLEIFDHIIGVEKIKAFHLNNSKDAAGSKKDRHTLLDDGLIDLSVFAQLVNDKTFKDIPKVIEPCNCELSGKNQMDLLYELMQFSK